MKYIVHIREIYCTYTSKYSLMSHSHVCPQRGHPLASSNACQLVLKYMLMNKDIFTKAFHDRCYAYSSGTKFEEVVTPLKKWMKDLEKARKEYDQQVDEGAEPTTPPPPKPKPTYTRLVDHDGLYTLIGDAIMSFIELKPQPYGLLSLKSKEHFQLMPALKTAMTFVFMSRYLLGFEAQRQWKKFSLADYKFNTRMYRRFTARRGAILDASIKYQALPDTYEPPTFSRCRARSTYETETVSSDSPMKRRYVVADDSTDEEA